MGQAEHVPAAATLHAARLQVFLNGEKLPVKTFMDYVELYLPDKTAPRIYERFSDRWEVCITPSDGQFHQVPHFAGCCGSLGFRP